LRAALERLGNKQQKYQTFVVFFVLILVFPFVPVANDENTHNLHRINKRGGFVAAIQQGLTRPRKFLLLLLRLEMIMQRLLSS
jgi:hypothetical protein